jgi:hypothetical protein
MGIYNASWEDEENNRSITMAVGYKVEADNVVIEAVTPQSVAFRCPTSGEIIRKIGVHTQSGREMLARQFSLHVGLDRLAAEVNQSLLTAAN